jgi:transposase
VAEIDDFSRFDNPRELMGWLGIVPSEYSSGGKQRQGGGSPSPATATLVVCWSKRRGATATPRRSTASYSARYLRT